MITIIDIENSVTYIDDKHIDNTPFNPNNFLVSVGYKSFTLEDSKPVIKAQGYLFFKHNELSDAPSENNFNILQGVLDNTQTLCGHNIKHDLKWLRSCGFTYEDKLYDTMVAEYVLQKGQKSPLDLHSVCTRYGLEGKKGNLVQEYWDKKIGFEAIPWEIVEEYGMADVDATANLFIRQCLEYSKPQNKCLFPTLNMSNDYVEVLVEIETNGIAIDFKELERLEVQYTERFNYLEDYLTAICYKYLGATKVNLDSPAQLSELIYSRRVKDKNLWSEKFNIGMEKRGASMKPKRRPRLSQSEFNAAVRELTEIVYKTDVEQCGSCNGRGNFYKTKRDGTSFKNKSTCSSCDGQGVLYTKRANIGGFKLSPRSIEDVSAHGFSTDKGTIEALVFECKNEEVKEFLNGLQERNAISTYRDTFITGIRKFTKSNGLLYPNLLQCVTATGRLSSKEPNLQNQPRIKTFPIRGVFGSRWETGEIISFDWKGLEYRCAVELAHDEAGYADIKAGVDPHAFTATHVGTNRQDAKPHTFAPLYGAMPDGKPEKIANYYIAFMEKHKEIRVKHMEWQDEAIRYKRIRLPTGREYAFPDARRTRSGGSTYATTIKNYPVQGFATADIVPCGGIRLLRYIKQSGLKSKIILTVHDDFKIDCYPGERDQVIALGFKALNEVTIEMKERYNYDFWVPLEIECTVGPNMRDGVEWQSIMKN